MPSPHICTHWLTQETFPETSDVYPAACCTLRLYSSEDRGGTLIFSGPQKSPLWMSQSLNGGQISKLSPTDSLWMQNTVISQGQGSPVGGSHFLPWSFSLGSEDHMTQMSAHNTNLALETGRWSWFCSYNWLHYGAETKNPWIFWPAPLWRSRENLRKTPDESKSGHPPLLSDSIWNRMAKIKDIFPSSYSEFLVSASPNTRIDFFPWSFLRPQSWGRHTLLRTQVLCR